jgi:hypothetical protein
LASLLELNPFCPLTAMDPLRHNAAPFCRSREREGEGGEGEREREAFKDKTIPYYVKHLSNCDRVYRGNMSLFKKKYPGGGQRVVAGAS